MITLRIDPTAKHTISPYLYMQFMEPLGVADPSIDAAWNYQENQWFPCVIDTVRQLAPTMVRFGGTMIDHYHWKEAVGPNRIPMINHCWGGIFSNRVGTHEVIDFCRQVNAEPLILVNMESDGFRIFSHPKNDGLRLGTAEEAAEWVRYCNDPEDALRREHGVADPYNVRYWQIGNETSYRICGQTGFDADGCYDVTSRFAEAMRKADPNITLIGWGDQDRDGNSWMPKMSKLENVEMLAFHHHFNSGLPDSPLHGTAYRDDIDLTWHHLMNAYRSLDEHIRQLRADCGTKRLAMTEGHFALPGRNRNEVLSSWGAGVAYARCLNVIMRHSDVLDIATMADFFGTVWQVNAVMLPAQLHLPTRVTKRPYLQPVGAVMSLFAHHQGTHALDCTYEGSIDAVASRTGNTVYLHIANTDMHNSRQICLDIGKTGRMYVIAADPRTEITPDHTDVFPVQEQTINPAAFTLPPAAVAAVEIEI